MGTAGPKVAPATSGSPPSSPHPVRVVIFVGLQTLHELRYRSLITPPCFHRSLRHQRRRSNGGGLPPRGRSEPLRRRFFEPLCAPALPGAGRVQITPGARQSVSGLL